MGDRLKDLFREIDDYIVFAGSEAVILQQEGFCFAPPPHIQEVLVGETRKLWVQRMVDKKSYQSVQFCRDSKGLIVILVRKSKKFKTVKRVYITSSREAQWRRYYRKDQKPLLIRIILFLIGKK